MKHRPILFIILLGSVLGLAYYLLAPLGRTVPRVTRLRQYFSDPAAHPEWELHAGDRCPGAPFIIPTDGYLGFGYGDSWRPGQRHQGYDVFGPTGLNETPVIAAHSGYLTRLPEWKSSVIIRVPQDPLEPARQIWVYYTHMAGPEGNSFIVPELPPGTRELYVEAGALLGFQGNYSGNTQNPVGMHLHLSIAQDDGADQFENELEIENTYDPGPYFGLRLGEDGVWRCGDS